MSRMRSLSRSRPKSDIAADALTNTSQPSNTSLAGGASVIYLIWIWPLKEVRAMVCLPQETCQSFLLPISARADSPGLRAGMNFARLRAAYPARMQ